jgi:cellobiose phosphorylase
MQFGYFDDQHREYVISRPDTPLPWINYLGTQDYFGIISNTAGGYSFYRDARLRRLTRYRYNNIPYDTGGRYLYLRDNATGEFWSPSWQPTRLPLDDYRCQHGLGYSVIGATYQGIEARTRYFVPLGETLEIWQVTLTNHRQTAAQLSVFSFVEFCLWDAYDDMTNFQRNLNIAEVEVDGSVIYHKTEYRERRDHFAYFACSEALAGFDTQGEAFLGAYGSLESPQVVRTGQSTNSMAHGWSPVGSHHVAVALQPGEQKRIIFLLGYAENPHDGKFDAEGKLNKQHVRPTIAKYLSVGTTDAAFKDLCDSWGDVLGSMQVQTPDDATNRMVNVWNAYQCIITFSLSRSASFYESGVGRGMGFRDSNQDLLGIVQMIPGRARERILDLAATQLADGSAYHQYQPLTKRGNNAIGSNFNDDPLWLVLGVAAYLKETGDWSILDEPVPYDNTPGTEAPLYDHLERSIRYTLDRLGAHGLPLIGRADWNDCLNLNTFSEQPGESFQTATSTEGRVAESVFIAGLFTLATEEMATIADHCGASSDPYRSAHARMKDTVLRHGWDGDWFLRAYDHFGDRLGSRQCQEGQIFIEPQGMCIMAGIGLNDGQAERALQAVHERLATPHGIVLVQPAFSRYYVHLGEISSYPPGYKENAGVFCHTNPWIMIAEAVLGHGDRAFDYYRRINPAAREAISEVHRCEPYVYAQMIAGKDAATHGEAKNSWLTGTAAWNYVAITQWILGIRPTYDGLQVAPVIPPEWDSLTVARKFRGTTYHIRIRREGTGNEVSLMLDGQPIDGTILPLSKEGDTVEVVATLR